MNNPGCFAATVPQWAGTCSASLAYRATLHNIGHGEPNITGYACLEWQHLGNLVSVLADNTVGGSVNVDRYSAEPDIKPSVTLLALSALSERHAND